MIKQKICHVNQVDIQENYEEVVGFFGQSVILKNQQALLKLSYFHHHEIRVENSHKLMICINMGKNQV
jgi:hypothetical protein